MQRLLDDGLRICLAITLYLIGSCAFSQTNDLIGSDIQSAQIHVRRTLDKMTIDGVLDEETWRTAGSSSGFSQYFPTDSVLAIGDSEIFMSYDEDHLYIAAKCYSTGANFSVESLKRDFSFSRNDNINFIFDTYNDRTNAFQFSMNPVGAQKEALISIGGKNSSAIDGSWDNKWYGEAKVYENYWVCEMAIPFTSIRYKEGALKWGFSCYRNDTQTNEISALVNIPREYNLMNLNYTAEIIWAEPLRTTQRSISLIPYATTSLVRDFENLEQTNYKTGYAVGGDAKIGLSSSLNLDLTINPDFSQVEVDQQVNNLGRFEVSFPEKRQFFLENADLFGGFGSSRVQPFFSRRIGVSIDPRTENNVQNTLYGGARLTGKLNEDFRVGFLSIQAAEQRENSLPSFNYSVLTAEHQVFNRSNIGMIIINKQGIGTDRYEESVNSYNRIMGLEYRLHSEDNFWTGKASYLQAFTPEDKEMKYNVHGQLEYNTRRFRLEWASLLVGDGFTAEVGFVPRKDFFLFSPEFDVRFFPKLPSIAQMTLKVDSRWIYKLGKDESTIIEDFGLEEKSLEVGYEVAFQNNHKLDVSVEHENFTLLDDFDPTRIQDENIFFEAGSEPANTSLEVSYETDPRKTFYVRFRPNAANYYGGKRLGFRGRFTYRYQPYGSVSLDYNFNHIDIGGEFENANLWLVGPRVDFTFTKKLFWTTFFQYNNRLENLNVNSRFQWRFAPVSDLFIVYTDNYNTANFQNLDVRNRALVIKFSYWLSM